MAMHITPCTLPKPTLAFCKKCSVDHEKPAGNKCEKVKNVSKEEKQDLNHENTAPRKTPKGKTLESQDKMLDLMMNMMATVTEKLAAMDKHI